MADIGEWLAELGLDQYTDVFEAEEIDIAALPHLTEPMLIEMGLRIGPRAKVLAAISELEIKTSTLESEVAPVKQARVNEVPKAPRNIATAKISPTKSPPAPTEAERRQLTVMFCDLVGSTELSTRFDPEVLREMMGAYQTAAGAVIDSYDGHVAQYLGDGLMVYFGWPHAHEDDAVRAVQAGLEVIEAVKKLDVPTELSVRVGIATGPVVVGATGGGDPSVPKTAVGETPNLAARVQGMAEPNTVAIGGITRGLIGGVFELDGLGSHSLKGIAKPVELYRVLGDKHAESRFEATYADHLTPVVGRDSEIAMQLDRWQRAKDGEGQVILLSGEPGIGKSRLIHMLREKIAEDSYTAVRYQCSAHYSNSAFYPAIDQLERATSFVREDSPDTKLDKLEALLERSTRNVGNVVRLFASLLSLPTDRYPTIDATPQQLKEQTVTALNDQLLGLASKTPVVFLIEDVQWCDPTTLELIGDAIARIIDARVLLVITYRPEFEAPWTGHAHVSVQTLNRLSKREGAEVVGKVTGGKSLPREVLDLIVAKTDGIPLYVEELTKNVLEAGFLKDTGDRYELDGPLPALAIPTTLQEGLIARLDRLNTVKTIAQIGACIGREFSHELVATVSPLSDPELKAAFQQLNKAQIILPQGAATQGSYIFKNALLQDAAYASLLKEPRRQFHDRIADGLQSKFPEVVANTPELLASHLAKAERFSEAVDQWKEAGIRAKNSSSNQEASSHFEMALELLGKEAPSPTHDKRELELQAPLALVLNALHGFGSPKTGTVYERAFALSRNVESPPELFQIMFGLSQNRALGEKYMEGLSIARELAAYADTAGDKAGYTVAQRWLGSVLTFLPDYKQAKLHCEKAVAAYEELNSRKLIDEYGHDPKAQGLVLLAAIEAFRGFPDRAAALVTEAASHAETIDFPFVVGFVDWMAAVTFQWLNDQEKTEKHARSLLQLAVEKELRLFESTALILIGWTDHFSSGVESLAKIESGFTKYDVSAFFKIFQLNTHIDALIRLRQDDRAKETISRALKMIEQHGCKWTLPEVLRLDAVCGLKENGSDSAKAETLFLESIELARAQKSKLWELRSATSLARLWGEGKERQKAYDLLFPVYDWYTEGFETFDLKEGKALLDQLQ